MQYLAIDPGDKRTGLAVGDDRTGIVSPAGVIETSKPAQRLLMIERAITEHRPDELVLGLALNMDASEGPGAKKARQLAQQITERTGLPIHLVDERLTSELADQWMSGSSLTHKAKKKRRDALAAMAILKRFLEQA